MSVTWVLLRGLGREQAHWGGFASAFERAIPGAQTVCIDLPGTGDMAHLQSPADIGAMMACCRSLLAAKRHRPPFLLFALSLGGMVAVEWATRFPEEIAGCVLVNTSVRGLVPFHRRLRPTAAWQLLLAFLESDPEARERRILALTSNRPACADAITHDWASIARRRPVHRSDLLRQLLAASRYALPRARPTCPVLILCSRQDRLVDPGCSMRLARLWNRPLVMHPDAGHDLPLDDGGWVVHRVAEWLDQTGIWETAAEKLRV